MTPRGVAGRLALTSLTAVLTLLGMHAAGAGADREVPHHIGFRILNVERSGTQPLTLALWYPTTVTPTGMKYPQAAAWLPAEAARDAPPAAGPFPLVIFSHGGGGCATQGAVFAEELAAHGFVVAGPDHGDEFIVCRSDGSLSPDPLRLQQWFRWARGVSAGTHATPFAHRPQEIKTTIDTVLRESTNPDSPMRGLVDPDRIGMMGVSFGAWTTLAESGAVPAFRDSRVKAAVPIAGPAGRPAMAERMANIRIPILLIFGEEETVVLGEAAGPRKQSAMLKEYEAARPPKILIGIKGAQHLDFGGAGTANRRLRGNEPLVSAHVRTEDVVIRTTNERCLAFFQRYLKGDREAERRLTAEGEAISLMRHDLGNAADENDGLR